MLIRVIVEPAGDFERWLANQEKGQVPQDGDSDAVENGRRFSSGSRV